MIRKSKRMPLVLRVIKKSKRMPLVIWFFYYQAIFIALTQIATLGVVVWELYPSLDWIFLSYYCFFFTFPLIVICEIIFLKLKKKIFEKKKKTK